MCGLGISEDRERTQRTKSEDPQKMAVCSPGRATREKASPWRMHVPSRLNWKPEKTILVLHCHGQVMGSPVSLSVKRGGCKARCLSTYIPGLVSNAVPPFSLRNGQWSLLSLMLWAETWALTFPFFPLPLPLTSVLSSSSLFCCCCLLNSPAHDSTPLTNL